MRSDDATSAIQDRASRSANSSGVKLSAKPFGIIDADCFTRSSIKSRSIVDANPLASRKGYVLGALANDKPSDDLASFQNERIGIESLSNLSTGIQN